MASELWQRMAEARQCFDRTQADIARLIGVSRALVALWESADASIRTVPKATELIALHDIVGYPMDWLLSDASRLGSLSTYYTNNLETHGNT